MPYPISISDKVRKLREYEIEANTRTEIRQHLDKALEALDYDTPELMMLIQSLSMEIKYIPMIREQINKIIPDNKGLLRNNTVDKFTKSESDLS